MSQLLGSILEPIPEISVWVLNIIICIIIIIFIYRQRLIKYPLIKNSFYGFYTTIIAYFSVHIIRHIYSHDLEIITFTWRSEATFALLAAWTFGNIIPTLNFPEVRNSFDMLKTYFKRIPVAHAIYSFLIFTGIAITWFYYPFTSVSFVTPEYKVPYVAYMSVVVVSAIIFPAYYLRKYMERLNKAKVAREYSNRLKMMTYSYIFIAFFVNVTHTLVWYFKNDIFEIMGYLIISVPLITMAYALKEKELLSKVTFTKPSGYGDEEIKETSRKIVEFIGKNALIEYKPKDEYEKAVLKISKAFLNTGRNIVLVSQEPRLSFYIENLKEAVKSKEANIIELTIISPLSYPSIFSENKFSIPIPMETLERIREITEAMPEKSAFIFESLSQLILARGEERKASVYNFISSIFEELSNKNVSFICFINKNAHSNEILSAYEGMFLNIFSLENSNLVSIKGERKIIEL